MVQKFEQANKWFDNENVYEFSVEVNREGSRTKLSLGLFFLRFLSFSFTTLAHDGEPLNYTHTPTLEPPPQYTSSTSTQCATVVGVKERERERPRQ